MIIRNRAKCLRCGEIVESTFTHDRKSCGCGALAVDGGHDYIRRCYWEEGCFEELSEFYEEPIEDIIRKVAGSMALSGMELTDEDKERIRIFAANPEEFDELLRQLTDKHRKEPLFAVGREKDGCGEPKE